MRCFRDIRIRITLRNTFDPAKINQREFIKRYRLTKQAFYYLCRLLREKTSLRPNKSVSLELKVGWFLVNQFNKIKTYSLLLNGFYLPLIILLLLQVLCALSFYATGSYQRIIGMAKYLGQTTVSKYVKEVTDAINTEEISSKFIKFPITRQDRELVRQK